MDIPSGQQNMSLEYRREAKDINLGVVNAETVVSHEAGWNHQGSKGRWQEKRSKNRAVGLSNVKSWVDDEKPAMEGEEQKPLREKGNKETVASRNKGWKCVKERKWLCQMLLTGPERGGQNILTIRFINVVWVFCIWWLQFALWGRRYGHPLRDEGGGEGWGDGKVGDLRRVTRVWEHRWGKWKHKLTREKE